MSVIEGQQERFTFGRSSMCQSYFRWKMLPIWETQVVLCRMRGDEAGAQRLLALIAAPPAPRPPIAIADRRPAPLASPAAP